MLEETVRAPGGDVVEGFVTTVSSRTANVLSLLLSEPED
jgi:hypothetical protein